MKKITVMLRIAVMKIKMMMDDDVWQLFLNIRPIKNGWLAKGLSGWLAKGLSSVPSWAILIS